MIQAQFAAMKYGKSNIKRICYDATGGYHIGFEDAVKGTHNNLYAVNFGASSPDAMLANMRAYIYDLCAKAVKGGFYINDPVLIEELRAQQWVVDGHGKRCLIPKKSIKTILGRSPDTSDAFAVGFFKQYINAVNTKSNEYYKSIINNIR